MAPVDTLLDDLGLLDSYAALLLPGLTPAFGVLLFRPAMGNAVPAADAALADGPGAITGGGEAAGAARELLAEARALRASWRAE